MTAVSEVPASVATLGARINQLAKAHTAFLHELVGWILVKQLPDLLDLFLLPCNSTCAMLSSMLNMCYAKQYTDTESWDLQFWTHITVLNLNWPCSGYKGGLCITRLLMSNVLQFTILIPQEYRDVLLVSWHEKFADSLCKVTLCFGCVQSWT